MSLTASVMCDCYERGLLRTPPPVPVEIVADGSLCCARSDDESCLKFDQWRPDACSHPNGVLASEPLGNLAAVVAIRTRLAPVAREVPLLMSKVVHAGTRTSEILSLSEVAQLRWELHFLELEAIHHDELSGLAGRLRALLQASAAVGKPIVF